MFKVKILLYWLRFRMRGAFSNRTQLKEFQEARVKQFCKRTLSKSPFYKNFEVKNLSDLSALPIIEKEEFMHHFDDINTLGIKKEEALHVALEAEKTRNFSPELNGVTVGLSTGTSGKRGIFLVSESERAQWVALVMNRVIKPHLFKKQKIAFFLRASSNLYSSVNSTLFTFDYYDLFQPIELLAAKLNSYKPDILAAPPSMLADLAALQESGNLCVSPSQLISFAEVLYDSDRIYIEKVFSLKIKEIYQCTEGFLGASCEYGTIHLNEDVIHVEKEYITANLFYPIITDFTRTTQPVVRYRLNDVLVEKRDACPCGSIFTALEKIEGRSDDVLLFKVNDIIVKIYPDLVCRKIAQYTDDFRSYKIIQIHWDQLLLCIQSAEYNSTKEQFTSAIKEVLSGFNIQNIQFTYSNHIELVSGAKRRKIERRFDENTINIHP